MHTDHSSDCATPVETLLATARDAGLGAIAITDHNEISGAFAAREIADEFGVKVIVAEEVKTAEQGEVIGLFLEREDRARDDDGRDDRRDPPPGRARLRPASVRPPALGARLRAPARDRRGDRHPRGLQPAGRADRLQRGGRALRGQVPDRPRRRLRQPRRPGARQRDDPRPRLRRPGGVPRVDARRRHRPQAAKPDLRAGAEVAADGAAGGGGKAARRAGGQGADAGRPGRQEGGRCRQRRPAARKAGREDQRADHRRRDPGEVPRAGDPRAQPAHPPPPGVLALPARAT